MSPSSDSTPSSSSASSSSSMDTATVSSTPAMSTTLPPPLKIKHSELRVVTNVAELESTAPRVPPSPIPIPALSPLAASYAAQLRAAMQQTKQTGGTDLLPMAPSPNNASLPKDLQFDPRFLAEVWSQESPQSVYAWFAQPSAGMHAFSPLAVSPIGPRLMSPVMHSMEPNQQFQQLLFQSQPSSSSSLFPMPLGSPTLSPLSRLPPYFVSPAASPHFNSSASHHATSTPTSGLALGSSGSSSAAQDTSDLMAALGVDLASGSAQSPTSALLRQLLPSSTVPRTSPINAKELTLNELRPHFNKPMALVAKELGVCITLMKKICRRNGLVRWPHRRIRSLVNRITSLRVIAGNTTGAEKKRVESQIQALRDELWAVLENPNEKSRKAQADAKARGPSDDDENDDDDDDNAGDSNADEERPTKTKKRPRPRRQQQFESTSSLTETTPGGLDTASLKPHSKRGGAYRTAKNAPPPIKIPRTLGDVVTSRKRSNAAAFQPGVDVDDDLDERPSSTTSTGSNGRRGSILSILCAESVIV